MQNLSTHFMRMNGPAIRWQDAAPIGNGLIGGLVFGHPRDELIMTNHGRLFEAPERIPAPEMTSVLPEVRRLLLIGERDAADKLWDDEWNRQQPNRARMGVYLPGPHLQLHTETVGLCTGYRHILDFANGLDTISFHDGPHAVCRRTFASRADDAIIMDVSLGRPTDLALLVQSGCEADGQLVVTPEGDGAAFTMQAELYGVSGAVRILDTDAEISWQDGACVLKGARHALLAYTLEAAAGEGEKSLARLKNLSGDFDALLMRHDALHRPMMEQVQLTVNDIDNLPDTNEHLLESVDEEGMMDALILRLFHFGRYLLISSTRPGAMPPNLQGIWNGDRYPAWASDYHNDVNIQMNYWQAPMGGLWEQLLCLFDYYDSLVPDFQDNARRVYGCRGILMSVSQTTCGYASSNSSTWTLWTGGGAWIAQHYYDYWRYTQDDEFLRNRALPFMREVALFYEDFVDFSGEKAIFAPSMSPENVPTDGQGSLLAVNATMDIALARELFSNIIAGCRRLGIWEEDMKRWEICLAKLPEYEVDPETGALREWLYPGLTENPHHRHESHLYGLFPGEEIGPDHPMFPAVRKAVEQRRVVGLNEQSGWSLGNMACVRARLGDGDEALDGLEVLARSCVGRNLFTYHNDWRSQGNTLFGGHIVLDGKLWGNTLRDSYPPYQIDANLCIPAAIMNMLLQVHGDEVQVLPALPNRWKKGKVSGLKLPGGKSMTIEWDNGAVKSWQQQGDLI